MCVCEVSPLNLLCRFNLKFLRFSLVPFWINLSANKRKIFVVYIKRLVNSYEFIWYEFKCCFASLFYVSCFGQRCDLFFGFIHTHLCAVFCVRFGYHSHLATAAAVVVWRLLFLHHLIKSINVIFKDFFHCFLLDSFVIPFFCCCCCFPLSLFFVFRPLWNVCKRS